jgi:hypothetical protein
LLQRCERHVGAHGRHGGLAGAGIDDCTLQRSITAQQKYLQEVAAAKLNTAVARVCAHHRQRRVVTAWQFRRDDVEQRQQTARHIQNGCV